MPNPRTPSPDDGGLRAVLERELEQRRGRAPEAGEIFVLPETAELPVEWALLEARPKAFLAIPADTQPLAGSRDFALGPHVLSGPLTLRCGHPVEIAAARLRPELRTGLLDPHSLAAVRSLQTALARGTAADDPMGEEVDRDPEYRDWVDEVLDPARAVMVGLGGDVAAADAKGAKVIPFEERSVERSGRYSGTRGRFLPWLVAASLAIGLGWTTWRLRESQEMNQEILAPQINEPNLSLSFGTVRGEEEFRISPPTGSPGERLHLRGFVPPGLNGPVDIVLLDGQNHEIARGQVDTRTPTAEWAVSISRSRVPQGRYRIELQGPAREALFSKDLRFVETSPAP